MFMIGSWQICNFLEYCLHFLGHIRIPIFPFSEIHRIHMIHHKIHYPYNKLLQKNVGFELDMFYESKSFEMMQELMTKNEKSCFWCIGNSNYIRG